MDIIYHLEICLSDNMPYEKIGNSEPVCIADEVPFDIPDSWEWVRWGSLSESIQYGYNAPAKNSGRIKMVRISDIQDNQVLWDNVPYCDIDEKDIATYLLKENDILFARTGGTVGKSYLVEAVSEDAIYAGYLIRTRYSTSLNARYMKLFMESPLYWSQLREGTIATAQPNCNGQTLSKMIVPIPPIAEQNRIVEQFNHIFPYVADYSVKNEQLYLLNSEFPSELKKSILQFAIQGKLVKQNSADEPASILLQQIKAEKDSLIKAGKLKKDKNESTIFRRDNSYYEKIGNEERCIDDEIPFDIPDNWEWIRLGNLISIESGKNLTAKEMEDGDIPVYGGNGITGYHNQSLVHKETLVIGRVGYYCGSIHITPKEAWVTDNAFITTYPEKYMYRDFLVYELTYMNLGKNNNATAQPVVSGKKIYPLLFAVPPLEEQKRIVKKLDAVLETIEYLS